MFILWLPTRKANCIHGDRNHPCADGKNLYTVLVSYNHSVIPISMYTISICAIFVGTNITNIYEEEKTQLGQYLCMHAMVSQVCIVFWVGKMHLVTRHFVRIPFPGETSTGNPIILQNT